MAARKDDPSFDVPEMFRDVLTDKGPLTLLAEDPQRASLAMLLAWKTAERLTPWPCGAGDELIPDSQREPHEPTRHDPATWHPKMYWSTRKAWAYGLSVRTDREITSADLLAWEQGANPVPTAVLGAALDLAGLDVEDVYMAPDSVTEWVDLVVRVADQLRPEAYIEKTVLPRLMGMQRQPGGKTWKGFAGDLGRAAKNLGKVQNLMLATLAEAERLRFLALASEDES